MEIILLMTIIQLARCNWESEWLVPIQDAYSKETPGKIHDGDNFKTFGEEYRVTPIFDDRYQNENLNKDTSYGVISGETMSMSLTDKLKNTLQNAKALAETLKSQIISIAAQEKMLKETIVSGRSGVTVLTVLSTAKLPRTYIIRDGFWTLCNGMIQYPTNGQGSANVFSELFAAPRCIGQEIRSRQDPCVFNSIVKYETIPRRRGIIYTEDDFLCLKPSFNHTLEQYLSVPRFVVNETCRDGLVKRLTDNSLDCGLRVMSEYTYYPHDVTASRDLPLEYCTERDGACKLIVAWHISNSSIENFELIKNDKAFKKFFMNIDAHSSQIV
ncbi:uncharacterized protein [Epargyreus clarus]|uniref:uncharacterized protein n=1 Tax=Epargyreus clarus TaxID=520877 RepID=UPI003C2B9CD3